MNNPKTAAEAINFLLPKYPRMAAITTATTGIYAIADINPSLLKSFNSYKYTTPAENVIQEFSSLEEIDVKTRDINDEYDLIFLDPWHTYEDSLLALKIAIRWAKPNSIILMHDCLSLSASLSSSYVPGAWSGVTCFVFKYFTETLNREYFVLDCNHGIGVIGPELKWLTHTSKKVNLSKLKEFEAQNLAEFKANPQEFMRGIPPSSFDDAVQLIEYGHSPAHLVDLTQSMNSNPAPEGIKNSRIWRMTRHYRMMRTGLKSKRKP
jgi:hypothetical protein